MIKKTVLAALVAIAFAGAPAISSAQIVVQVAPPPPRTEMVPAPRRGQIWVPGHWEWRQRRHVWVNGFFVRERRGYSYEAPRWTERDGRWVMNQGHWVRGGGGGMRDRDGDGVPNRMDSRPNNPNRN